MTTDEKREILEEVLEKMDECAEMVRSLHDDSVSASCLAAFEGKGSGWLGHFERDIIEEALRALDEDDDEEDAS